MSGVPEFSGLRRALSEIGASAEINEEARTATLDFEDYPPDGLPGGIVVEALALSDCGWGIKFVLPDGEWVSPSWKDPA